jgi:IS30 family transposase
VVAGWTRWERERIEQLVAEGAPAWMLFRAVPHSRHAVRRYVLRVQRVPKPDPVRSPLRLSPGEREEISRGLAGGESLRAIAARLGRAPSTICREVVTNGGRRRYRAMPADRLALRRMRRPKPAKLATCVRLRTVVEAKLHERWSPQQISGWLVSEFPDDPEMRVSHETIYLSLYVQSRGALRKELTRYLRQGHGSRRPHGRHTSNGQGQLGGTLNNRERPAEANDRPLGRRSVDGQTHACDGDTR